MMITGFQDWVDVYTLNEQRFMKVQRTVNAPVLNSAGKDQGGNKMKQIAIAKKLGISQGYLSKGLIWFRNKTRNKIKNIPKSPSRHHRIGSSLRNKLNLHRLYRTYELPSHQAMLLDSSKPKVALKHTKQEILTYKGVTIRLTSKHLIVEGIQLISSLSQIAPELLQHAEFLADGVASAFADERFKAHLNAGKTKLVEIAITKHSMAEQARKDRQGVVPLYWNKDTKKVEVWTDWSLGPDLESNREQHIERLRQLTKDIVEGRWTIHEQMAFNRGVNRFFAKHNALIDEITGLVKDLREERSRFGQQTRGKQDG